MPTTRKFRVPAALLSADQLQLNLSTACLADVSDWMRANRLQLSTQHSSKCVRDLGIYIDSDVSMRTQVTRTVVGGFCVLRRLRTICRSVPDSVFQSLVVSLVLNRLDFGNATFAGLPAHQYRRLHSVLNAAARLIYRRRRFDHVTPLLRDFHWLKVLERVAYKLAVTVYR